jgi:hypothetical protein
MMNERDLVDAIFKTALAGSDGDITARKNALWITAVTLMGDVLLNSDPFTRERLLRGLENELREGMADLSKLMGRPGPYPQAANVPPETVH